MRSGEPPRLADRQRTARFEEEILVHLDAAHNLARWITRDAGMAKDAVQDGCLRAFQAFDRMQGPNAARLVSRGDSQHVHRLLREQPGARVR